jgi:alkylated DNA repair dioxygenase AlkB
VRNLEAGTVREMLSEWPAGAELIDQENNTLFHVAACEPVRYGSRPEEAGEVVGLLLKHGWKVVDQKNLRGERAEVVAKRLQGEGNTMKELLERRSHDFHESTKAESQLELIKDTCAEPWKWEYPVQDEQRRCWAGVLFRAVGPERCDRWFRTALEEAPWQTLDGVPRRVAWFVSQDFADCPYRYSDQEYRATVYPPFMEELRNEICRLCGIPPEEYPNSCNVNVYDDHEGEVGWHSDDEVYFQGVAYDTRIISFSLGSARDFRWRLQGTSETLGAVALGDGDVMTMEGLFQKHYKHSVPRSDVPCGKRINFTFRWIVVKAHAEDATTVATK